MQETINNSLSHKTSRRSTTKEERQLHVDNWKKSGLTMSEYCRQNNVAIASLSDWKSASIKKNVRFQALSPTALSPTADALSKPGNSVEILIDQRIKIRLSQVTDVSFVLNIVKGLMSCS